MNIFFIILVKILMFFNWSYSPHPLPQIMLSMESKIIIIFWARNPTSSKDTFSAFVLPPSPNACPTLRSLLSYPPKMFIEFVDIEIVWHTWLFT